MSTQEQTIEKLVEELSKLSVLDMSKLKTALEEKWDVKASAGAPMMMAAAPAAEAAGPESTEFLVTLESIAADKKIGIIKVVRELTGLGLKEAKDLVESAPKVLKESTSKSDADEIVKKAEAVGAKVSVKGL